jgi:hypothetical protein
MMTSAIRADRDYDSRLALKRRRRFEPMPARMFMVALVLALPASRADAQDGNPEKDCQRLTHGEHFPLANIKNPAGTSCHDRSGHNATRGLVEVTVGSPPMHTEDTGTAGNGKWEVNIGLEGEWGNGESRVDAPMLDIDYGVGERLQVAYEVSYAFVRGNGEIGDERTHVRGVGDSTFGVKYRFYDNEKRGVSLAVHPRVRVRSPGADLEMSEGGTTIVLPLVLTREFEGVSTSAGVGVEIGDAGRRWFGGAGIGWRLGERTAALAELVGGDLNSSERRWTVRLGLRQKLDERRTLSASIGRDIATGGGAMAKNYFMMSWGREFGD